MNPWKIECNDALIWLKSLPDNYANLIITDPPYESLEKHRSIGTTTRLKVSKASNNKWFPIFHNHLFPELFAEIYRVLAPNSHFYLFCDAATMFVVKSLAEQAKFKFWKPLVWNKKKFGLGYHYRSQYEFILFFEKGKRKLKSNSIADIIECSRVHNGYPTEKPFELIHLLVKQSSSVGDVVIDPFMGSGTTCLAALMSGCNFDGCDILEEACALTKSRLVSSGFVIDGKNFK